MRLAIVGATGLVGQNLLQVLETAPFPISQLLPIASARSQGQTLNFRGQTLKVLDPDTALEQQPQIAIFSAGSDTAQNLAPRFMAQGCYVVDNSSAFRMLDEVPLVIPEINGHLLQADKRLIANPNCSTIQLLMALYPLHKIWGLGRIIVSTYQSITGTGAKAIAQYQAEAQGQIPTNPAYPHPIFENCLPHCDQFLANGYTKEEMKLLNESRKILALPNLALTATAVRVPTLGGHAEAVNVQLRQAFTLTEVRQALAQAEGLILYDNPAENQYPMPKLSRGRDEVWVGRLRLDESQAQTLNLWIVADNLRKGAATNAVQIAQKLIPFLA